MIKYRKGYKYQLAETYNKKIGLLGYDIEIQFIRLYSDGNLIILSGYSWDGPSGPAIDTDNFMEGSLVHDVLYQLLRMGVLPKEYRKFADNLLKRICIEKGMSKLRAWWVFQGVDKFAFAAASPENKKPVYTIQ